MWQRIAAGSWQLSLVGSHADTASAVDHLGDFLHPPATLAAAQPTLALGSDKRGLALPQAICFNAQAWSLAENVSLTELGQWQVALQALRDRFLHTKIREQGSAYGAMAGVSGRCVRLVSYRDPRLDGTFADYRQAIDTWPTTNGTTALSNRQCWASWPILTNLSLPFPTASRAFHWWSQGLTSEDIAQQRQAILRTTAEDIRQLGQSLAQQPCAVASAADKAALAESKQDWIVESW